MKKYQLTFKEQAISNSSVVSRVFDNLSPPERAKTFMATCEAFAKIEGMETTDPEALYYHAMSILKGKKPDRNRATGQMSMIPDMSMPTSATKKVNSDLLDRINTEMDKN